MSSRAVGGQMIYRPLLNVSRQSAKELHSTPQDNAITSLAIQSMNRDEQNKSRSIQNVVHAEETKPKQTRLDELKEKEPEYFTIAQTLCTLKNDPEVKACRSFKDRILMLFNKYPSFANSINEYGFSSQYWFDQILEGVSRCYEDEEMSKIEEIILAIEAIEGLAQPSISSLSRDGMSKDQPFVMGSDRNMVSCPIETKATSSTEPSKGLPRLAVCWDCIEEQPNAEGGKLLSFKLKPNLDALLLCELFPAVEPFNIQHVTEIFGRPDSQEFLFLQRLGYDIRSPDIFILPDRVALISNWRRLQEEHHRNSPQLPLLPELTILSSEGIANDREFVDAYLTHVALLSEGKEFVHDHLTHLIPLLLKMRSPEWTQIRARVITLLQNAKEKVMQGQAHLESRKGKSNAINHKIDLRIQQLETVLGMFTDSLAASPLSLKELDKKTWASIGLFFSNIIINHPGWREFWESKYSLSEREIGRIGYLLSPTYRVEA